MTFSPPVTLPLFSTRHRLGQDKLFVQLNSSLRADGETNAEERVFRLALRDYVEALERGDGSIRNLLKVLLERLVRRQETAPLVSPR